METQKDLKKNLEALKNRIIWTNGPGNCFFVNETIN